MTTIKDLMNAEVSSYLRAQSDAIFDDLEAKLVRAQTTQADADELDTDGDGIPDSQDEDYDDLQQLAAQISDSELEQSVKAYMLAQAYSGDSFFDFNEIMKQLQNQAASYYNKVKDQAGAKLKSAVDSVKGKVEDQIKQQLSGLT